jgi:hypothetical protein
MASIQGYKPLTTLWRPRLSRRIGQRDKVLTREFDVILSVPALLSRKTYKFDTTPEDRDDYEVSVNSSFTSVIPSLEAAATLFETKVPVEIVAAPPEQSATHGKRKKKKKEGHVAVTGASSHRRATKPSLDRAGAEAVVANGVQRYVGDRLHVLSAEVHHINKLTRDPANLITSSLQH